MITDAFIAERERIEHDAALAAYRAGLGASEWQAFVSKEDWETYFALGNFTKNSHRRTEA